MSEEHIVSETTLGSSNYFSRWFRGVIDSIKGIFGGVIMLVLGFTLLYYSVGMKENAKIVGALPLTPAQSVTAAQTGIVKITGKATVATPLIAPKGTQAPVLYYRDTVEEWRKVEEISYETRTVQRDGQDVQQQVEKRDWVEKWVPVSEQSKWADFSLGTIRIEAQSANINANYTDFFKEEKPLPPAANASQISQISLGGKSVQAYPSTKTREIVSGIPADQPLIAVGELNQGAMRSGDPFIISNKTHDELLKDLKKADSFKFWLMKGGAWLLIALGFSAIFGPIFALMNLIPGMGSALGGLMFLGFAVLSAVIVLLGSLVIAYWYVLVALIVLGLIFAIYKKATTHAPTK